LARDLFLKPEGSLYPSQGGIWFCPFSDEGLYTETNNKVKNGCFGTLFGCGVFESLMPLFSGGVIGGVLSAKSVRYEFQCFS
jgi:type I protein arginine methyltransferase